MGFINVFFGLLPLVFSGSFNIFTYIGAFGGIGFLAQAFRADSWYLGASSLDSTFSTSRAYLLIGGILAVAIDAYVIAMPYFSGPPDAPAEETPAVADPATENAALIAW